MQGKEIRSLSLGLRGGEVEGRGIVCCDVSSTKFHSTSFRSVFTRLLPVILRYTPFDGSHMSRCIVSVQYQRSATRRAPFTQSAESTAPSVAQTGCIPPTYIPSSSQVCSTPQISPSTSAHTISNRPPRPTTPSYLHHHTQDEESQQSINGLRST
jgi:hypothetical protein